jgi:hypothetical protein
MARVYILVIVGWGERVHLDFFPSFFLLFRGREGVGG